VNDILEKVDVNERWDEWGVWDKFLCVFAAIAACAPFINAGSEPSASYGLEPTRKCSELVATIAFRVQTDLESYSPRLRRYGKRNTITGGTPSRPSSPKNVNNDDPKTNQVEMTDAHTDDRIPLS
jgi:hypothetical protein